MPIGCRLVAGCSSGVGGAAAHALQLSGVGCADHVGAVVSWSGVLLLMSGGWLLSWLLFVVSVGCQLVGVLLSSRCRFSVVLSHLVGVSVASDGVRCCPHIGSRAGCSCPPIGCASCRGVGLLMFSRCREGVAVILSGSVAVALRCQSVGGVGVLFGCSSVLFAVLLC